MGLFIAMNHFQVAPERGDEFEAHWRKRESFLSEVPGFRRFALLRGDAAEAVAALKQQNNESFTILGSGELIRSLVRRNLIDEFILLIFPIALGTGRRLFPDGEAVQLRLVESFTTTTGVIIANYQVA